MVTYWHKIESSSFVDLDLSSFLLNTNTFYEFYQFFLLWFLKIWMKKQQQQVIYMYM